jgi:hypothetical protein
MWKLINRTEALQRHSHFVFVRGDDVAIADHSLNKVTDPASTEDGLLLWDGKLGTIRTNYVLLRIKGDRESFVSVSTLTAYRIQQATGKQVIPDPSN